MLFGVLYLPIGFLLLGRFVFINAQNNGQQSSTLLPTSSSSSSPQKTILLNISPPNCTVIVDGKIVTLDEEIMVEEGSKVDLSFISTFFVSKARCVHKVDISIINQSDLPAGEKHYKPIYHKNPSKRFYEIDMIAKPYMSAHWSCLVLTNENTTGIRNVQYIIIENSKFVGTKCEFNLKVLNKTTSAAGVSTQEEATPIPKLETTTLIYISAGVVVFIIIAAQTVSILYFKAKARKMARIRRISQRASTDDNDKNRYIKVTGQSQPKGIRNWLNKKTNNKDDSDIYETLEELRGSGDTTPPVPPIETIPTLRPNRPEDPEVSTLPRPEAKEMSSLQRKRVPTPDISTLQRLPAGREPNVEIDISKRPPLPLPSETVEEKPQNTMEKNVKRPLIPTEEQASPRPQRMLPTVPSKPSSVIPATKGKPRQVPNSIVNELDHKLKLRNVTQSTGGSSPSTSSAVEKVPPAPAPKPSKESTSIFFKKKPPVTAPAANKQTPPVISKAPQFQLPEKPNPMPTGKSAVLLGLSQGPVRPVVPKQAPAPMPKPPSVVPKPPRPLPVEKTPTPIPPVARVVLKPPLPTPAVPIQEELYQEMDEPQEDYNSDDEWCYEPLPQYNIYSS